jgi:hypothetical protein
LDDLTPQEKFEYLEKQVNHHALGMCGRLIKLLVDKGVLSPEEAIKIDEETRADILAVKGVSLPAVIELGKTK